MFWLLNKIREKSGNIIKSNNAVLKSDYWINPDFITLDEKNSPEL